MTESIKRIPKPEWLRIKPATSEKYLQTKKEINNSGLHTVCQEANCPNLNECWSAGTATIMILGDTCTRGCRFCNVKTGNPKGVIDDKEPQKVASQVLSSKLKYVVLTCVDRDDLEDGGANAFAQTVMAIKKKNPNVKIETLISDYAGNINSLKIIEKSHPDVIAHNLEVVRRLTPGVRDPRASYQQSLKVLKDIKEINPKMLTKSSLMVGLGETKSELEEACFDLRKQGVDVITFGQYLQPTKRHLKVQRFYSPKEFKELEVMARAKGFIYVASGPLVRSSYKAAELFLTKKLKGL